MYRFSSFRAFVFVLSFGLCLSVSISHASATPAKRQISVSAQAELQVNPDVVDLRFTLQAEKKTPKQAVSALKTMEQSTLAALKKAGLSLKEVQVSYLTLSPRYSYRKMSFGRGNQRVLTGYRASKTFVACLRDVSKMAHFVEALAGANVTSFSTSYRSTTITSHKRRLRAMAVQAAKLKAAELAQHAGVKVGKVISIQEIQNYAGFARSNSFAYRRSPKGLGAQPGAITLRLTVNMSYAIQ